MKRFSMILAVLALAAGLNAQKSITLLHGGDTQFSNGDTLFTHALSLFHQDFPDVQVQMLKVDLSNGSTLTMDALLAAGKGPNVYQDNVVRVSKYLVPAYALDLRGKVRDLAKYQPSAIAPYTRNGAVLGVPMPGGAQGMLINTDITGAVGFTVKDDWTIGDFLHLGDLVKAKYGGTKFLTGMFAANQSGDYLLNNWFAAFGVSFYQGGDYTKTTIAKTGGDKVYAFYQDLVKRGFVPPGAATLSDDDYAAEWAKGNFAATAFFPSWIQGYIDEAVKQGQISQSFGMKFVPFPRAPGVAKVPTYISTGAMVVRKTNTEADTWAARLVEYMNDQYAQNRMAIDSKVVPNRTDVKVISADPLFLQTIAIANANGVMDVGLTVPKFPSLRAQGFPVLQKVLNLAISPMDAIREYERRLNDVLSE